MGVEGTSQEGIRKRHYVFYVASNFPLTGGECLMLHEKINRALGTLLKATAVALEDDAATPNRRDLLQGVSQAVRDNSNDLSFGYGQQGRNAAWQRIGGARLVKLEFGNQSSMLCIKRWTARGKLDGLLFRHATPILFQPAGMDYQVVRDKPQSDAESPRSGNVQALMDSHTKRAHREDFARWGRWVEKGGSLMHSHDDTIELNSVARFNRPRACKVQAVRLTKTAVLRGVTEESLGAKRATLAVGT
jgi:hypothetical protein